MHCETALSTKDTCNAALEFGQRCLLFRVAFMSRVYLWCCLQKQPTSFWTRASVSSLLLGCAEQKTVTLQCPVLSGSSVRQHSTALPLDLEKHVQISLYLQPNGLHSKTTTNSANQAEYLTGSRSASFTFHSLNTATPPFICIQINYMTKVPSLMMFLIPSAHLKLELEPGQKVSLRHFLDNLKPQWNM